MSSTASERHLKKHLRELAQAVTAHIRALDNEMKKPSDNERGKRIAALLNVLEMQNDRARYFALGVDYRTDKKSALNREAVSRATKETE